MTHFVEFLLEDGNTILVEVNEEEPDGVVKAARGGILVAKAQQTFDDAMEIVRPAAAIIIDKLRRLSDAPQEVEVQFGLKLNAEAGAVVAATGIEANYVVTLKWKKEAARTSAKRTK